MYVFSFIKFTVPEFPYIVLKQSKESFSFLDCPNEILEYTTDYPIHSINVRIYSNPKVFCTDLESDLNFYP